MTAPTVMPDRFEVEIERFIMVRNRWGLAVAASMLLGTLAAPVHAGVVSIVASFKLYGVNVAGNQNKAVFGNGTGKLYKDTNTGILIGVGSARVPNLSGQAAKFVNVGYTFFDPFGKVNVNATSDTQNVSKPFLGFSASSLTVVYNPAI